MLGIAVPFGTMLGLLAGYFGGWTEIVIMRLTDIALAIPPLVMALAVAAVLSPDLINAMLAIAALWWTWHTRLIYSITRQIRTQEFVEAAETLGASASSTSCSARSCPTASRRSRSRPRSTPVSSSWSVRRCRSSASASSRRPPTSARWWRPGSAFLPDYWWESVLPGVAILFVALGFNLLGDGLRDLFDVEDVR